MEKTIIGVYHSFNPIGSQRKERLESILIESYNQDVRLLFFADDDINFSEKMIRAKYWNGDGWTSVRSKIPEVTINLFPKDSFKRTSVEKLLRRLSVFTSYNVMNKYDVHKKLDESDEYRQYTFESIKVNDYKEVLEALEKYEQVVLKPILGRQGMDIYFIYRSKDKFIITEDDIKNELDEASFKMFVDKLINDKEHIVQPYIKAVTKKGEPYDFRIHTHRDGNGEWDIVDTHPKIGSKKGILTNISRGGNTYNIDEFLKDEFGTEGKRIRKEMEKLAIDLSIFINTFSNNPINEIGVDIAIDEKGNYFIYELNGGPQSKNFEGKRAKYVIEYAKYLYDKELKERAEKQLKELSLEILKIEDKILRKDYEDEIYIGILTNSKENEGINFASNQLALEKDLNIFYFYPNSIDYDKKSIKGLYYDGLELKSNIFTYPDIIIDRMDKRGFDDYEKIYEEFKDIRFNMDIKKDFKSRNHVFNSIKNMNLRKILLDYKYNPELEEIIEWIEKYEYIVLKPDIEFEESEINIVKNEKDYEVIHDGTREKVEKEDLDKKLEEIMDEELKYIMQEYKMFRYKEDRPFIIKVHMVKGEMGKWEMVNSYTNIGGKNKLTADPNNGGYIGELNLVLDYKFESEKDKIEDKIYKTIDKVNEEIENNIGANISEVMYSIFMTDEGELYLYDIDLNKSNPILYEYDFSKRMISYAIHLAKEDRERKMKLEEIG